MTEFIRKGKDYITVVVISILIGAVLGAALSKTLYEGRVEDSIKLGRFLYKNTVYDINQNVERQSK